TAISTSTRTRPAKSTGSGWRWLVPRATCHPTALGAHTGCCGLSGPTSLRIGCQNLLDPRSDAMELLRALAVVAEAPHKEQIRFGEMLELPGHPTSAEHTDLFDFQLSPYASVYLGTEAMIGGEARDRIAGFWRAIHLDPPSQPDHLV